MIGRGTRAARFCQRQQRGHTAQPRLSAIASACPGMDTPSGLPVQRASCKSPLPPGQGRSPAGAASPARAPAEVAEGRGSQQCQPATWRAALLRCSTEAVAAVQATHPRRVLARSLASFDWMAVTAMHSQCDLSVQPQPVPASPAAACRSLLPPLQAGRQAGSVGGVAVECRPDEACSAAETIVRVHWHPVLREQQAA